MKQSRNAPTHDEILARIQAEEQSAYGTNDSELSNERAQAIDYYLGKPFGNEVEGRSQVVSTDVADTIESLLPALLKVFVSGDKVVTFDPKGPEDIDGAEQETDAVNHIVMERNTGFNVFYTWFKDALLSKMGYVKVYWEEKEEVEKEFYRGLTDDEFALIGQDAEVEITEHTEYPDEIDAAQRAAAVEQLMQVAQQDQNAAAQLQQIQSMPPKMLHDVRVQTKETKCCIEIENVAPEAMMVSVDTKSVSLQEARFVQHRETMSISEAEEMGFDVPEDAGFDSENDWLMQEANARDLYSEQLDHQTLTGKDRKVMVKDTYMRVNGELMRYVVVGNSIVLQEEAEIIPFAAITPVIMPHRHVGRSVADMVMDIQLIKSTLQRGQLDGMYLALNPRHAINERVNLDDFLVSRPGGVVRVTGTIGDAIMPLITPDVSGIAYPMLEYMDGVKENRTGVTKYNQGLDANSLNKTASGINQIMTAAQQRMELIARIFAEGGVKELFMLVHRLTKTHSQREMVLRLRNKWVTVDPRQWKTRTDMTVSVGLGTGNKDQMLQHLMMILQVQREGMQIGLATPKNIYNAVAKLTQNAGFKAPEEFWTDPSDQPPQPPQEDPLVQVEKIKQQGKQQEMQMNAQMDVQKFQAQQQQEQLRSQNDVAIEQAKIQAQMELERWKAELEAQTELEKQRMQLEAEVQMEAFRAANQAPPASVSVNNDPNGDFSKTIAQMMEQQNANMQMIAEMLSRPKQIIRGADGRAMGVQ